MNVRKRLSSQLKMTEFGSPSKRAKHVSLKKDFDNAYINEFKSLFEGEDDFDLIAEDINKENNAQNSQNSTLLDLSTWKRCVVEKKQKNQENFNFILDLREEDGFETVKCHLQGPWFYTKIELLDLVSVQGAWNSDFKCYEITAAHGYIVTNPDCLISGTSVVGSLFCKRRGVLQDKFRGLDGCSKIMTVGSVIHELFQVVLIKKLTSYEQIEKAGKALLHSPEMSFNLYSNKLSVHEVEKEIQIFIPNIVSFVDQYITGKESHIVNKEIFSGSIDSIQDIEENLWVPQLGLKGKVDVSVQVRRKKNLMKTDRKYMPLELKTGAASFSSEHKGQVIFYQMMLTETGRTTDSGLLLYLRNGIMKEIPASRNEKRDLIILRNDLGYYLSRNMKPKDSVDNISQDLNKLVTKFENLELPEPINHRSACGKCPYNTICCSFLKVDDSKKLSVNHGLQEVSKECTSHLKDTDLEYFINWCGILSLEEKESRKSSSIKALWTESAVDRSRFGRAIIDLKVFGEVRFEEGRYIHTFKYQDTNLESKGAGGSQADIKMDLTLSGIGMGDYVIVSTTKRISIAAGHVYDLTKTSITLRLERNLIKNYSAETFTIDKHESQSGNIYNFTNLGVLLDNSEASNRLRRIVVDKIKPTFSKTLPKVIAKDGIEILTSLNQIQRKAVIKALTANEYLLIKGLPGTGKTQTLVTIIRLLNMIGKSVVVTSHTHSAVDNVLLRLKQHGMKFIRLGSDARIISQLHEFSETHLTANCKSPEDLRNVYSSYNIVGVTCFGSSHPVFVHRTFDVCIVDEATQVFQPTILRPLFYAQKFILVGDPEQLPPLVRSKVARNLGGDESLFQRLDSSHSTFILTLQYRMNRNITKLANELTYHGDLNCANEEVTLGTLTLPNRVKLQENFRTEKWIFRILEKHVDLSAIFLDTQNCLDKSYEFAESQKFDPSEIIEVRFSQCVSPIKKFERKFKCTTNYCDAAVALRIVKALVLCGYSSDNIGIIAPYRAQVELLRKLMESAHNFYSEEQNNMNFSGVEVNTVDQYQGRDKEIIIYSCTKTGQVEKAKDNEILEDRRRLTVAITRAKYKLIIIGDEQCLNRYTPFNDMLTKIPSRCKIKLVDGNLGFSWKNVLEDMKNFMNV